MTERVWVGREPVAPAVMALARKMAASSKLWGSTAERAILCGHWDDGEIVRGFVRDAEAELLRNRPEVFDD